MRPFEVTDEHLSRIERLAGSHSGNWDCLDPRRIVAAAVQVCGPEQPNPGQSCYCANCERLTKEVERLERECERLRVIVTEAHGGLIETARMIDDEDWQISGQSLRELADEFLSARLAARPEQGREGE